MRTRALLTVVAVAWSLGACSGDGSRPASHVTAPGVITRAEQRPLPFSAEPLWSDRTKGAPRYADRFALRGDGMVVVSGAKNGEADRLSVVDAGTGRRRWSVRLWAPLGGGRGDVWDGLGPYDPAPQVVERGRGRGVLVRTTGQGTPPQPAYGLALLSGEDGHVLWRRTLVQAAELPRRDPRVYPGLLLSDGATAVVSMRPPTGATVADLRLTAVDAPGHEVDRSGTPLIRALPEGFLSAVSDRYAVFRSPESEGYQVYRVG